jgi:hypothetical protein
MVAPIEAWLVAAGQNVVCDNDGRRGSMGHLCFWHLLEWYRTIEVLVAKQWMMVEAASILSMLTRVETNDL